jgi:hypothetical protein
MAVQFSCPQLAVEGAVLDGFGEYHFQFGIGVVQSDHAAVIYLFGAKLRELRGAGSQTCCVAGFRPAPALPPAGFETCGTAVLEICGTKCLSRVRPRQGRG